MIELLEKQIRETLSVMGHDYTGPVTFGNPKDKGQGHLSSNVAMLLAREFKQKPKDLAREIVAKLELEPAYFANVEVAGNGFINFFYSQEYLHRALREAMSTVYGAHDFGAGSTVVVEFVSANPTGPLSIGHGRQAVIGDVIARVLANAGYSVTREYYFNNAGKQMRRLGESIDLRYREILGERIEFPDSHYQGAYIEDIANLLYEEQGRDCAFDIDEMASFAEAHLFKRIKSTLRRIGINFDVYFNEDSLYRDGKIDVLIEKCREAGLLYDKDGAVWLDVSKLNYDTGKLPDQDRVMVKNTGEPTYRLPDIAYHITKFERNFDLIIDIFGSDHIAQYPDVVAVLAKLGYDTDRMRVVIHQFVTLSEAGEVLKMSKRMANYVTIDELGELLGQDVFRYFMIMRSHQSHFNFDLQLALMETMENPVFYVQNAHARICSIEKKAVEKGYNLADINHSDLSHLTDPLELNIILKLLDYPVLAKRIAETFEIHHIPTYLEELAASYHAYQTAGKKNEELRVITSERGQTMARLALCSATRNVIRQGLALLGVSAPTYMSREDGPES